MNAEDPLQELRKALGGQHVDEDERRDMLRQALIYAEEVRELHFAEKARADHLELVLNGRKVSLDAGGSVGQPDPTW